MSTGKPLDLTYQSFNIDIIMDAIVEEYTKLGKEPPLELAVRDKYDGRKYSRFKARSADEEARYQESKDCAPIKKSFSRISEDGEIRAEDEKPYICEFCSKLRGDKYDPEICDNCTECEMCSQFNEYECSGCQYSIYRTGRLYSESIPAEKYLTEHDLRVFENVRGRNRIKEEPDPYDDDYSVL